MEEKSIIEKCLDEFKKYVGDKETRSIPYAAIKAFGYYIQYSDQETTAGLSQKLAESKARMIEMARKESFLDKSSLPLMAALNIYEHVLYKDMSLYQTESMKVLKKRQHRCANGF